MQILSQTPFTKMGVTTQRVFKVKRWCRTILNLEEKLRWSLRQAWPFQVISYYVKSGTGIAEQASICVFFFKPYTFNFFKWPNVTLDKSLIHRLVSFIALWSCTETVILTFNRLESIGANYMDTNPGMFSSKTFIYFRLKKEIHKHLGWYGDE